MDLLRKLIQKLYSVCGKNTLFLQVPKILFDAKEPFRGFKFSYCQESRTYYQQIEFFNVPKKKRNLEEVFGNHQRGTQKF
jgi:hypothetical protein